MLVPTVTDLRGGRRMQLQRKEPTSKGSDDMFTGDVWLDVIVRGDAPSRIRVSRVRFAPGARTAWHAHAVGQTFHVVEGIGRTQARGGEVLEVHAGDTVYTSPGEWHWHGAAAHHFMTHLAMWDAPAEGLESEWGDLVSDEEYNGGETG
jgi:quercetin dioxygenase-like cupin family protein